MNNLQEVLLNNFKNFFESYRVALVTRINEYINAKPVIKIFNDQDFKYNSKNIDNLVFYLNKIAIKEIEKRLKSIHTTNTKTQSYESYRMIKNLYLHISEILKILDITKKCFNNVYETKSNLNNTSIYFMKSDVSLDDITKIMQKSIVKIIKEINKDISYIDYDKSILNKLSTVRDNTLCDSDNDETPQIFLNKVNLFSNYLNEATEEINFLKKTKDYNSVMDELKKANVQLFYAREFYNAFITEFYQNSSVIDFININTGTIKSIKNVNLF